MNLLGEIGYHVLLSIQADRSFRTIQPQTWILVWYQASYDLHEVVQENEKLKQEKQDLAEKLLKAENAISSSGGPQEKVYNLH